MTNTQDEFKQRRDQLTRLIFVGQRLLTIGGFVFGLRRARKLGIARPAAPIAAVLLVAVDLWAAYQMEAGDPTPSGAAGIAATGSDAGGAGPTAKPTVAGVAQRLLTP